MDYPYDLGRYSRKVTASSAQTQRWVDRGLNWCFGFHHEEAVVCFEKALECDPSCAMAQWGIAYAVGPNYNIPWELQDSAGKAASLARAFDATRAALALCAGASAPERALIEALPARYPPLSRPSAREFLRALERRALILGACLLRVFASLHLCAK